MAFHPYPQLIPPVFNLGGSGPPHALTRASTWPWVDHPASGLEHATKTPSTSDSLSLRLPHNRLTSRHALTRRLILQKARHHPHPPHKGGRQKALTARKRPVSGTLSLPSRGTFHHSLTVLSAIGHQEVFRQPSGLDRLTQDSTSPMLPRARTHTAQPVPPTGLSPTTAPHPKGFSYQPRFITALPAGRQGKDTPHNPATATPAEYHTTTV